MGRKRQQSKVPGLLQRGDYWTIDKKIFGRRIREATGTKIHEEAQAILARRIEETRQAVIFGVRPKRTFKEAVIKYVKENQHKDSIETDKSKIRSVAPYVNDMPLDHIHMGSLQIFIQARRKDGVKTRTINHGLQVIRRILNLAASEWIDENRLTWIASPPKIKLLPEYDNREPEPLSWEQEARLMQHLPKHLKAMATYALNTGSRDKEVVWLQWEWEVEVPELNTSVFILPHHIMVDGKRMRLIKNGKDRLVILNHVAKAVVDSMRGKHKKYVFTYRGEKIRRMNNSGWRNARTKAGLPNVRVHDLKHTLGRRLRSAGVSFEDRQDLLGHTSGRITTHYSGSEIGNLMKAANKVCQKSGENSPMLSLVKRDAQLLFHKKPTWTICDQQEREVSV